MKFVLFCHPPFMQSQSMPRFARMIGEAMQARGHEVVYWAPQPMVHALLASTRLAKWAGYVDQYLLFPLLVRARLLRRSHNTLYVFCDQALGPWVPLVKHLPHVVHAHDLLALRSALGQIPQNPTSRTGRVYQRYIRRGFQQGRHFICVSRRTQEDLLAHGHIRPESSHVVYNGLNHPYKRLSREQADLLLAQAGMRAGPEGMILHVGGGQWYKNTAGVIHLYAAYASRQARPLPLWMVSPQPTSPQVLAALAAVPPQGRVQFFQGISNDVMEALYSVAAAFVFPSLAEGFGWPIVEAQACGCPVLTTDDSPMNEIAGPQAHYLPLLKPGADMQAWAHHGADELQSMLDVPDAQREQETLQRMVWAAQFTNRRAIDGYWQVYEQIMAREQGAMAACP
ncbi:MAG: glycosyltransferase family 1 protein [Burkholderiales bacterium]|nr:MAG: glycosyltransferase family 1 protein [Burkholderiales bacterium]